MNTAHSASRIRDAATALVIALAILFVTAASASAFESGRYVALGDSYTAGPLIGAPTTEDAPLGCIQSINNFPHLIRPLTGLRDFTDVGCSGAETEDMLGSQGVTPGPAAPQFDALTPETKLVTISIGGNDIGFSSIATDCLSASPFGRPCQKKFVIGGVDTLQTRINNTAPDVGAVIQGIRSRSPLAKVYVIGYPDILPTNGIGCWPIVPITNSDLGYLNRVEQNLNAMLKTQATANGATFVDTYTPTIGHDACKGPVARWIEPVVPTLPGAPIHPNTAGHVALARIVWNAIRAGS